MKHHYYLTTTVPRSIPGNPAAGLLPGILAGQIIAIEFIFLILHKSLFYDPIMGPREEVGGQKPNNWRQEFPDCRLPCCPLVCNCSYGDDDTPASTAQYSATRLSPTARGSPEATKARQLPAPAICKLFVACMMAIRPRLPVC